MNSMDWADLPDLKTPYVLVQKERLLRNIRRGAAIATEAGIRLRPHVKTHKSIELAALQHEHGAEGLTASKPSEAEIFVRAGFKDVLVAYPVIDPERIIPLLRAADCNRASVTFIADSREGLTAVEKAAQAAGRSVPVRIKIDVGLHRCGIAAESPALEGLAEILKRSSALIFDGLVSHAGHAYGRTGRDQIGEVAAEERRLMLLARERLTGLGLPDAKISVGSTPTVFSSETFAGIDEIRPGNYVFLDLTAVRLGIATHDDIALAVVATIVSANEDYYIVDAGSKALTSDLGAHSSGGAGFGLASTFDDRASRLPVVRLSEEHGFVERRGGTLPVGTRMLIYPNHACPVVNLFNRLAVYDPEGEPSLWSVDARGRSV
ncbi:alanine racemase [Microvirga sp. 17 mud 1-3]|nr:alanine racemase [Microvirga sp. 17 mud 1-3]